MHFLISKNFADLYRRREPEGQDFSKQKCTLCAMFLVCPFCLGYHKGFFKKNKILPSEVVGTKHLNKFMRGIYANDALIPSGLALELSNSLRTFIKAYSWQAHQAFVLGLSFFRWSRRSTLCMKFLLSLSIKLGVLLGAPTRPYSHVV